MESRQQVYYWKGVIDPEGYTDTNVLKNNLVREVLSRLLAGEYRELNLERLRGHNVFSVRLNKADRMLFTTENVKGVPHIMVLDVVLNHDYDKSPFLKPAVLRNYLLKTADCIVDRVVSFDDFDSEEAVKVDLPRGYEYDLKAAEYFNHQFIEFSVNQNEVVTATLPLAISGAAGSGKSCVALSLIANHAQQFLGSALECPILYVAKSEMLCRSMERDWQSMPLAQCFKAGDIQFVSYDKLIECIDPEVRIQFNSSETLSECVDPAVRLLTPVGFDKFCEFIKKRFDHQRNNDKSKRDNKSHIAIRETFINKLEMLYQEFRAISGCATLEMYQELGSDQTLLPKTSQQEVVEREWLFKQYPAYAKYLDKLGCVDVAFYQPNAKERYELIVVDETQDLSHLQISFLARLAISQRICLCEDARQSLTEILAKRTYFARVIPGISIKALMGSYRCPNQVISMANSVMELVNLTTGHKLPEVSLSDNNNGQVSIVRKLEPTLQDAMREAAKSPDFAVVTLKQYVKEAIEKFGTQLVMTVEEIKGFQYRHVVIYRLLDEAIYHEANAVLDQNRKLPTNEKFGPAFNALYTACTRAMETLTVVQANTNNKLDRLITYLEKSLPKNSASAVLAQDKKSETSLQDWLVEIRMHLDKGQHDLAERIATITLKWKHEEYLKFRNDYLMIVEASAETPVETKKNPVKAKSQKKQRPMSLRQMRSQLAQHPSEQLLQRYLSQRDVGKHLFESMADGDSLFTKLCHSEVIRDIFLEKYFPKYFDAFFSYFNARAFLRAADKKNHGEQNMPGIYWLAQYEKCMQAISRSENFVSFIDKFCNMISLVVENPDDNNGTALYALSCYPDGVRIIQDLIKLRPVLSGLISPDVLFSQHCHLRRRNLKSSLFQNLLVSGAPSLEALVRIVKTKRELAMKITLNDFFPEHEVTLPPLCGISTSAQGKALIAKLQKLNPDICLIPLNEVDDEVLIELEKQVRGVTDNLTFDDIMADLTDNNLVRLLLRKPLAIRLFEAADDKECAFVEFFDVMYLRNKMIDALLRTRGGILGEMITADALCRKNRSEKEIPPLLWLVGNESLSSIMNRWMKNNFSLFDRLPLDAINQTVTLTQYLGAKLDAVADAMVSDKYRPIVGRDKAYSVASLLPLSVSGRTLLTRLIDGHSFQFNPTLTDIEYIRMFDKAKISLFMLLTESADGHRLLGLLLEKYFNEGVNLNAILKALIQNGELPRLVSRLDTWDGIRILYYLSYGTRLAFTDEASTLLAALTSQSTLTDGDYSLFKSICKHPHGMVLLINLVEANPALVENLNRMFFHLKDGVEFNKKDFEVYEALVGAGDSDEFIGIVNSAFERLPVIHLPDINREFNQVVAVAARQDHDEFRECYPLPPNYLNLYQRQKEFFNDPVRVIIYTGSPIEMLAINGNHAGVEFLIDQYLNSNLVPDFNDKPFFQLLWHATQGYIRGGHYKEAKLYIDRMLPHLNAENKNEFLNMVYLAYLMKGELKKFVGLPPRSAETVERLKAYKSGLDGSLYEFHADAYDESDYQAMLNQATLGLAMSRAISSERAEAMVDKLLSSGADINNAAEGYIVANRKSSISKLLSQGLKFGVAAGWAARMNDVSLLRQLFNAATHEQRMTIVLVNLPQLLPCMAYYFIPGIPRMSMKIKAIIELYTTYIERGMFSESQVLLARYTEIISDEFDCRVYLKAGWLSQYADTAVSSNDEQMKLDIQCALQVRAQEEVKVDDLKYLAHINNYAKREAFAKVIHANDGGDDYLKTLQNASDINYIMCTFKIPYQQAQQFWSTHKDWCKVVELHHETKLNLRSLLAMTVARLVWILQGSRHFAATPTLFMLITKSLLDLSMGDVFLLHDTFSMRIYGDRHITLFAVRKEQLNQDTNQIQPSLIL